MTASTPPDPSAPLRHVAASAVWSDLVAQARRAAPVAFAADARPLNLVGGEWGRAGRAQPVVSPVDGRELGALPMLDLAGAHEAVELAAREGVRWARTPLAARRERVRAALDAIREHRDLIARLLVWEIGKPLRQAETDVDRCVDGVDWYVEEIESMLDGRAPLGLVSNIASWNYPYSVLVHAVLVQVLAGNAAIAKTPTDGGVFALTLGFSLAREAGLPVSLVSGSGSELGPALVRGTGVDCLAFVGGRSSGRAVAAELYDGSKRHILEMEGVNAYGIWEFSDWDALAAQMRKGYDYGKQRCTAYARFVVQRRLFPRFLQTHLAALGGLRIGNPVAVADPGDPLPVLDFGPLISSAAASALRGMVAESVAAGAIPLYDGSLDPARFLPGQDVSAYVPPAALLGVPRHTALYHKEPFGPVDTVVVVDTIEELIAEMNVSNGSLVASVATDDPALGRRLASEVRGFKVGVNSMRSRGDRAEVFGGLGESWRGCFVGGRYLVEAITAGPAGERLHGHFPDYTLLPAER